jgi:hypothetical protein
LPEGELSIQENADPERDDHLASALTFYLFVHLVTGPVMGVPYCVLLDYAVNLSNNFQQGVLIVILQKPSEISVLYIQPCTSSS